MIAVFVTFDAPDLDDAVVRKVGHDHGAGAAGAYTRCLRASRHTRVAPQTATATTALSTTPTTSLGLSALSPEDSGIVQPPLATTSTKASASKLSVPTSVWIWINVPFGWISKAVNVSAVGTSSSVPSTCQ